MSCINSRLIRNPYTHKLLYVECGHCEACLQKKANRNAMRIRNQYKDGFLNLFVTLKYDNDSCPYIYADELFNFQIVEEDGTLCYEIPVYRDCSCRDQYFPNLGYNLMQRCKVTQTIAVLRYGHKMFTDDAVKEQRLKDIWLLKKLRGQGDNNRIGICYYPDVQKFIKRLRINAQRKYGLYYPIKFFSVSEYGPTYGRPHFHLLIQIPAKDADIWKHAIHEAWPYGDYDPISHKSRHGCDVQIAKAASEYVSAYVNCSTNVPSLLSDEKAFCPKKTMSQRYGYAQPAFSLDAVQECLLRGTLTYNVLARQASNVYVPVSIPLPSYVINSIAPKFTGYHRLNDDAILHYYISPQNVYKDRYRLGYTDDQRAYYDYCKLKRAQDRCKYHFMNDYAFPNLYDYAFFALQVRKLRFNESLKSIHEKLPLNERYDIVQLDDVDIIEPNKQTWRVMESERLTEKYHNKEKQKKVSDGIFSNVYKY